MHFKKIRVKVVIIASIMLLSSFVVLFNGSADHQIYDHNTTRNAVILQNSNIGQYPDGNNSQGGVYDPYNQELYVTNYCSNNVTVVNSFLNHSVANIAVGSEPFGITYVPFNHDVYVNNYKSNNISVITSVSNTVISSIKLPGSPQFSVYDPLNETLYVSGYNSSVDSGEIWVINVTDNSIISTPPLPFDSEPYGMAFDPYNGYIYVADNSNNAVFALSPSGEIVAYIHVGQQPYGVAFDPTNRMLYVSDNDFNGLISGCPQEYNVTIINTVNNTFVKNVVPGTSPEGVMYDPVNGYVYVANYRSGNISIINPSTESIFQTLPAKVGTQVGPSDLIYDPVLQQMISINDVSSIDKTLNYNSAGGSANQYMDSPVSNSLAYDQENHLLYVPEKYANYVNVYSLNGSLIDSIHVSAPVLSIIYANNTVFAAVTSNPGQIALINPETNTVMKNVSLSYNIPDGLAYDSRNNTLFIAFPSNNYIGVMDLTNYQMVQTLNVGIGPAALTYSNITNAVYVAQEDSNIHIINASSYANIYPYFINGSTPSQVIYDPNTNYIYIANSGNNSMFVINESQINYNNNGGTPFYTVYLGSPQQSISLNPSNGLIYIMQSSTDNVTIFNPVLNETVGSIYSPSLSGSGFMTYLSGSQILLATDSNNYLEEISPAPTFNVTIGVGHQIPSGNTWKVQIQPSLDSALAKVYSSTQLSNQSLFLSLPDGTYDLNISTSYSNEPPIHSYFVVSGSGMNLTYYKSYYVNFTETGNPSGTAWYVNLSNGQTFKSTTDELSFTEHNGLYSYTVSTTNKTYSPSPSSGSFTVNGANVSKFITFSKVRYTVTFTESGLPPGSTWYVSLSNGVSSGVIKGTNYSLPLTNGSYTAQISSASGYFPTPSQYLFTVNGEPLSFDIFFALSSNKTFLCPIETIFPLQERVLPGSVVNFSNPETVLSFGSAFDNSTGYLFMPFTSMIGSGLYVYNTFTGQFLKTINDPGAYDAVYDPSTGSVYVISVNGNLSEINPSTLEIVKNVSVPSAFGSEVFINQHGSYIYAYSINTGNISKIDTSNMLLTENLTVGSHSHLSPIYTVIGGNAYFANATGNAVLILNLSTGLIKNVTLPTDYTPFSVTQYYGSELLIGGENYSDLIYNISSASTTIGPRIYGPVSSTTYDAFSRDLYVATYPNPDSFVGNITEVNTANNQIISTIPSLVTLGIAFDSTTNQIFADNYLLGSVSVYSVQQPYTVTFTESGLPTGSTWYVNLSNGQTYATTANTISFPEPNGTYSYTTATTEKGYSPSRSTGSFDVNGSPVSESVKFVPATYKVTFSESGLPSGVEWFVNGSGLSGHAFAPSDISFNLVNGSYVFTVTNLSNYYTTTYSITVNVAGKNVTETTDYYHWAYIKGTLSPSNARLAINGKDIAISSSGAFNVSVANGTYRVVASLSGYNTYYSNFTLDSGNAKNLIITLNPISKKYSISKTEIYAIIGAIVAIAVIVSILMFMRRR